MYNPAPRETTHERIFFPEAMIRRFINKVFGNTSRSKAAAGPRILPLAAHGIRREQIHPCALKTTRALKEAGFSAFVVGGAVRDLVANQRISTSPPMPCRNRCARFSAARA